MKRAVIHSVYASDDILNDEGWDGVQLYVAINHEAEKNPVLAVSLDEDRLIALVEDRGYTTEDCTEAFEHNGQRWVKRPI